MKKLFYVLFVIANVLLLSCSNDNEEVVTDETVLFDNIDLESIARMGEFTDSVSTTTPVEHVVAVDTVHFETEEEIINYLERKGLSSKSFSKEQLNMDNTNKLKLIGIIGEGTFRYTTVTKTGYTSRTQSKLTMYLLDGSAASSINVRTGFYAVYTYVVKLIIPKEQTIYYGNVKVAYKDYYYEDSPNCGYVNYIWGGGYVSVNGRDRGYSQIILANGDYELQTVVVEVVASQSGGAVNKWIPCHINDIQWKFGRLAVDFLYRP